MDTESFKVLAYEKITDWLASCATSVRGRELCHALIPSGDFDTVVLLQNETKEAAHVMQIQTPPWGGIYDLRHALQKAARGSVLALEDLREVMSTLSAMRNVKYFFRDLQLDAVLLKERAVRIEILGMLERNLQNTIDEHGNFRDDASAELKRMTRELHAAQNRVKDRLSSVLHDPAYQKFFQDAIVTVRNERYVIPVKQEYRSDFPGVIHDRSASGATLFVEPLATVELNNIVKQTELARTQEIQRILRRLTAEIAKSRDILSENSTILAELDLIFARAVLGQQMNACPPLLNRAGRVHLKRARHPLISPENVVPIDIRLGDDFSILLITGPNTGGKTVSMKTLGVLALLAQSGCFLPTASGSELPVYRNIYADIGDEQSIEQSLSTFSAHTRNIVRILQKVGRDDLVLLDEVGAGTDPDEGAALARGIIEHLLLQGIHVVATTHYSALKTYAYTQAGIENACVEFDLCTLRPTYRLMIGVPGASNAFAISRQLGLPSEIVSRAESYVHAEHVRFEHIVNELEQEKRQYEEKMQQLRVQEQQIKEQEIRFRTQHEKFSQLHKNLLHKAREEANTIIREARRNAEETIKALKEQFDDHGIKERRKAMQTARERLVESYAQGPPASHTKEGTPIRAGEIRSGDIVYVTSLAQEGTVYDVHGKELTVQVGGLRTIVKMNACTFIARKKNKKRAGKVNIAASITQKTAQIHPEIDIRGMTVDEAEVQIGKFIDDAVFSGLSKVMVIHGKGTGALRQGVQAYLKHHASVLRYTFADTAEGGSGATVVELK